MSDVLIGQGFHLRNDPKNWSMHQPYPPLASLYAASYLRERRYEVGFYDAMLADPSLEGWTAALERHRPEFAVLYEDNFNFLTKMCPLHMREAALEMAARAREADATVIVSSSDAADRAEQYLAGGTDYVLHGEGEPALALLLDRLTGRTQTPLEAIDGLIYRLDDEVKTASGHVGEASMREPIDDLDALPRPAWDLVELGRYRAIHREHHGFFSVNMITSRGCPFGCNWCAKPFWGRMYHTRTPADVAEEMQYLETELEADHVWFMDDMFGVRQGWTGELADELERRDVRIPFKSLNRVDLLLRDGEIENLRRAGCQIVWSGVESGSQKILDAMDKGITVEQIRTATARLKDAGLEVGFFLQFGYPGETRADIRKTFQLVRDCRPDQIGISVSYPLPGTKFYEMVEDQLGEKENWSDSDDLAMMFDGPFPTSFYRRLHRIMHHDFRLRKAWDRITGRRSVSDPRGTNWAKELAVLAGYGALLPLEHLALEYHARKPHDGLAKLLTREATGGDGAPAEPDAVKQR